MLRLPTFQNISSKNLFDIELELQIIQFTFDYNYRNASFFISIVDQENNPITNVKMVTNWPLFEQIKSHLVFVGDILVLKDDTNAGVEITYDNFGNGWNPYYLNEAELDQWRLDNGL